MKHLTMSFCMLALVWAAVPLCIGAAEPNPKEMLMKSDQARGNVSGIEWEIVIDSVENNREQHRTLLVKARDFNSLAEFLSPAKVKGEKLLMIDRNMWFVKPGLQKPVPISPRQKLLGGASNGDIASTNYAGDYEVVQTSKDAVDGEPCLLLDLKAANPKATYDRIRYWISEKRLLGVKAEFYTASGKLFKTAAFDYQNHIMVEGKSIPFVSRMTITNAIIKDDVTVMTYRNAKTQEIPDSTFNLNLLVR